VAELRHLARIGKTFVHSIWLISAERPKQDGGRAEICLKVPLRDLGER
jgi:hypothetical protein